ncbi:MAG: guanylate kinase [Planctomycetota bacterium]|nr:guanylate kinase [Planctomycetota bacterium]
MANPHESSNASTGKLVIISGPSGAGKSTVLSEVFRASQLPLRWSVSATTRAPRPGEVDGKDYHYLDYDAFQEKRKQGDFLECFEVYGGGDWYGTLKSEVAPRLESGDWVVLEIDVEGTRAVLDHYPDAITIFVRPGDLEQLGERLRARGTEAETQIQRRLEVARREMESISIYRHVVVNNEVDIAVIDLCRILDQCESEAVDSP